MKAIFLIMIWSLAPKIFADDQGRKIQEGDYILAFYAEDQVIDPEVIRLAKNDDAKWSLPVKVEGEALGSTVHVVSTEFQEFPEIFVTVIARSPAVYRQVGSEKKVGHYAINSITLHGKLGADGVIRGSFVKTMGGAGKPEFGVDSLQGRFVLKPLKAQQSTPD